MVQERNAGAYRTPKKKKTSTGAEYSSQRGYADYLNNYAAQRGNQASDYLMPDYRGIQGGATVTNLRDGWSPSQGRYLNDPTPLPPAPTNPGPAGGGYGRGGGGGGGRSAADVAGAQATALQQLLNSRAFTAGSIDGDMGRVNSAVDADKAAADGAYGDLAAYMGKMQDPYANMELSRTPTVDPSLLALLGANGADTNSYMGQVELANTQAAQGDSAADRLRQMMSGVAQESQKSRLGEAESARVFAGRELEGQRGTLSAALEARQREEQKALDNQKMQVVMQLIAAMAESGQGVDVSQFFGGK